MLIFAELLKTFDRTFDKPNYKRSKSYTKSSYTSLAPMSDERTRITDNWCMLVGLFVFKFRRRWHIWLTIGKLVQCVYLSIAYNNAMMDGFVDEWAPVYHSTSLHYAGARVLIFSHLRQTICHTTLNDHWIRAVNSSRGFWK